MGSQTKGGKMKRILGLACALLFASAPAISQDERAKLFDEKLVAPQAVLAPLYDGYLAQIADGLDWKTVVTLMNMESTIASVDVSFYADNGQPLTLNIVGAGQTSTLTRSIPPYGSVTFETAKTCLPDCTGWAYVDGNSTIVGGQAILRWTPSYLPVPVEATVPLVDELDNRQMMPFDHLSGVKTGLALANTSNFNPMTIYLTFRDEAGNQIGSVQTINLPIRGHVAFMLDDQFPILQGWRGTVEMLGSLDYDLIVLGLRAAIDGRLTTLFPMANLLW
jgi:hypothetical protein